MGSAAPAAKGFDPFWMLALFQEAAVQAVRDLARAGETNRRMIQEAAAQAMRDLTRIGENNRRMVQDGMAHMGSSMLRGLLQAAALWQPKVSRDDPFPRWEFPPLQKDGALRAIKEEALAPNAYGEALYFSPEGAPHDETAAIITPVSGSSPHVGHNPAEHLLKRFNVMVTNWTRPHHVSPDAGPMTLAAQADAVIDWLEAVHKKTGKPVKTIIGISQSVAPVLIATILMRQSGNPAAPVRMILQEGPYDPPSAPTEANRLSMALPPGTLEHALLKKVPGVDPKTGKETGVDCEIFPFELARMMRQEKDVPKEFGSMDMPGRLFRDMMDNFFRDNRFARGEYVYNGRRTELHGPVLPSSLTDMDVLVVEGKRDDVCRAGEPPSLHSDGRLGQTQAFFRDATGLAPERQHYILRDTSHTDTFRFLGPNAEAFFASIVGFIRGDMPKAAVPAPRQTGATPHVASPSLAYEPV